MTLKQNITAHEVVGLTKTAHRLLQKIEAVTQVLKESDPENEVTLNDVFNSILSGEVMKSSTFYKGRAELITAGIIVEEKEKEVIK